MRYFIFLFIFFSSSVFAGWSTRMSYTCDSVTQHCDSLQAEFSRVVCPSSTSLYSSCQVWDGPESPCPDGQTFDKSAVSGTTTGTCVCQSGDQPDLLGRCPAPECSEGQAYDPVTDDCYPTCEDGTLICCDSLTPPSGCPNAPPCDDLTDPDCSPDQNPECGENQYWNGTTCVNQDDPNTSSSDNSSSGNQSSQGDSGGDSSNGSGGDVSDGGDAGNNSSVGNSGSSSGSSFDLSSEGSLNSVSGGEGCDSAPICSGDPIMCATLRQNWEIRCAGFDGSDQDSGFYDFDAIANQRAELEAQLSQKISQIQSDMSSLINIDFSGGSGALDDIPVSTKFGDFSIGWGKWQNQLAIIGDVFLACSLILALTIILRR